MRFLTSGESHGKALAAIIDGFPSNLELDIDYINSHLKRRMMGYGRGGRMKIETDEAEFLSGVRFGKTLGSPITIMIENRDWKNWTGKMASGKTEDQTEVEKISVPRPGHADLVGTQKYAFDDIRNSIERSSARETAARVAACSIARKFLEEFGIKVGSFVESIGGIYPVDSFSRKLFENDLPQDFDAWKLSALSDKSEVRVLEEEQEEKIKSKIQTVKKNGDTLGGTFYAVATGVPQGLGSFVHYDRKLSAEISHSIMSINAIKAMEIGDGFRSAEVFGSEFHDEITLQENGFSRKTNRAGGIEGGVSTGLPIIVRAAMKPIATLMSPIGTVDLATLREIQARRERSDFTAVPACAVIAESMLAWSIAKFFLEKFGGDSIQETKENFMNFKNRDFKRTTDNFSR
ncbi:MAG: chorismate synthase [Ignavibacteria bacterium]|nr:chorismate synthase [Ignavibacteria bacterium]MCU7505024.1 chorismate synthase [Ignavibacteria bacterium]MCU7515336.1 chorismate synthase [Ignavibacteria bacterium]